MILPIVIILLLFRADAAPQDTPPQDTPAIILECFNITLYVNSSQSIPCSPQRCRSEGSKFSKSYQFIDSENSTINSYEIDFGNPLPMGYLIKTLGVQVLAAFGCNGQDEPTSFSLSLEGTLLATEQQISPKTNSCDCLNCATIVEIDVQQPPWSVWWPGFNYDGKSALTLTLLQNSISLTGIQLQLYAVNLNPKVSKWNPELFPVFNGSEVDTPQIIIYGENFYWNYFVYMCRFIGNKTNDEQMASYINSEIESKNSRTTVITGMACNLPNITHPEMIQFYIYPVVSMWTNLVFVSGSTGPYPFYYYIQPTITDIRPKSGATEGGTKVHVLGKNFFTNSSAVISCRFGNLKSNGIWYNSSHISCISPKTNILGPVLLQVSENDMSWTDQKHLMFTYEADVTPWADLSNPHSQWVFITCLGLLVFLFLLGGGYIYYQRRFRDDYDIIDEGLETPYFISMTELDMQELIGHGSFANVYRGVWRHTEVAVKKIHRPTDALITELYREADIMMKLRHPNIVTFMACTTKPEVCLVTEYVLRGSLYSILHDPNILLELDHVRKLAMDTCKGMAYLHGSRIIHRDLKSHNLLVDKAWVVKVADFGLSRAVEEMASKTMTACGTPCWTAPEIIRNQPYTLKVDVYSFAICLWEMLSRDDPYPGMPPYQVVVAVAKEGLRPTLLPSYHLGFRTIVQDCWDENPEKRPAFGELVEQLQALDLPQTTPFPLILQLNQQRRKTLPS